MWLVPEHRATSPELLWASAATQAVKEGAAHSKQEERTGEGRGEEKKSIAKQMSRKDCNESAETGTG